VVDPEVRGVDASLVARLLAAQFPQWAGLPVRPVELPGWDNTTYRLGDELSVRLPNGPGYAQQVAKEQRWLPVLAPQLPLPVPEPVAEGVPDQGYPYRWSVYRWLDGRPAEEERIGDLATVAVDLAGFLHALAGVDPTDGPEPGPHNGYRGAPVAVYAEETYAALEALGPRVPGSALAALWEEAVGSTWTGPPVWFHGDVAVGNLLVRDGRLAAVIDFGSSGVGDPACDLAIAWTLFDARSRAVFREAMAVDDATWARGRGWALWKALITLAAAGTDPITPSRPRRDLERILADAGLGSLDE
jgi:aminoglycoside phosphotransferase (APT) family kinase protein